jgi:uncharacterized membrane protein
MIQKLNQGISREQTLIISHQLLIPISFDILHKDVDVVSKDVTNFYIFIYSIVTLTILNFCLYNELRQENVCFQCVFFHASIVIPCKGL